MRPPPPRQGGPSWPSALTGSLLALFAVGLLSTSPAQGRPRPSARPAAARVQVGRASYYHPRRVGRVTASGKRASALDGRMAAASPSLPLGTIAKVTNQANGRSVHVKVEDRGPYAKNRILDLSPRAARALGMTHKGVATVKVRPIARPGRSHVRRPEP